MDEKQKSTAEDRENNVSLQIYRPKIKPVKTCVVKVKRARNLHNGQWDAVDTPDPFVEVFVKESAEQLQQTSIKSNERNPSWNEELPFHYKGDPDVDIKVKESNYFMDGEHGSYSCKLSAIPKKIALYDEAVVELGVSCRLEKPDVLCHGDLCPEEKDFIHRRKTNVFSKLKCLLGKKGPKTSDQVPIIAIMGSGGGFRALTGLSGAFKALKNTGILDCAMYTAGLSGSSWYLSTLYSHPDWPDIHPSVIDQTLRESISNDPLDKLSNIYQYIASIQEKRSRDLPWSFTDIFGHMIGDTLIPNRKNATWSSQRAKLVDGRTPMPLLSCIHADADRPTKYFHEWVEISPFEVHMSKYGTSIKMEDFGSEFFQGKVVKTQKEHPLHYIQGICGSAFTALHKSFREMSAKSPRFAKLDNDGAEDQNGWLDRLVSILNKFNVNFLDDRSGRAARVPNWMKMLSIEEAPNIPSPTKFESGHFQKGLEMMDTSDPYLCLVDAGLVFNSPYPIVLRPKRKIDLILSFEFTDRHGDNNMPFKEILIAKEWAECHRVPFPKIDTARYEGQPVQEVYIFEDEDNANCPTIMHFVMVNNNFRKQEIEVSTEVKNRRKKTKEIKNMNKFRDFSIFDDPDKPYDCMNFQYKNQQFDRLSSLMEFNVNYCLDQIIDCIAKCVTKKAGHS